jgi:hypothetical protein
LVGAAGATEIVSVAVVDPAELEAVTVNVALAETAVGVPEMEPVLEFRVNPAGRAGLIE